jgi:hypothetical protein
MVSKRNRNQAKVGTGTEPGTFQKSEQESDRTK